MTFPPATVGNRQHMEDRGIAEAVGAAPYELRFRHQAVS